VYSNAVDLLALSAFIYEIVDLRTLMKDGRFKKNENLTEISLQTPKSFGDVQAAVKDILPELLSDAKKADKKLHESLMMVAEYFDKESDMAAETLARRELYIVADDEKMKWDSCVHAIAVNKAKKRVDVVFRGTSEMGDWKANLNAIFMRNIDNPIQAMNETLPRIKLHRGFAHAVLGHPRKDQGNETYKHILENVKSIMRSQEDHQEYRLFVTGHSLGGATSTLFAFFAAADSFFTGPIHLYSFASPRVGGKSFRQAFRHLEERGRIRHARIHNAHDKVTHHPYFNGLYKHVGLQVRLNKHDGPQIDYPFNDKWFQDRTSNILTHIWTSKDLLHYHDLKTMFYRLRNATEPLRSTSLQKEYVKVWDISIGNGRFKFLNSTTGKVEEATREILMERGLLSMTRNH
jgi:hypothetical protein